MSEVSPGLRRKAFRVYSLLCLWTLLVTTDGLKNQVFHMAQLCQNQQTFLSQIARTIGGSIVTSQNEHNLRCMVTFQTETVLQKLMLRFETLNIDCNDHLYIYEANHDYGQPKLDLSCRNTKNSVGLIYTNSNYVTLKYVTDKWGVSTNGFTLVITAFKDIKHSCVEFLCKNEFCIDKDLTCDGTNHCGDDSDEGRLADCPDTSALGRFLGLGVPMLIGIVVGALVVICGGFILVMVYVVQNRRNEENRNSHQLQPLQDTNGSLDKCLSYQPTTSIPGEGNTYLPARGVGYNAQPEKFYYHIK